MSHRRRFFLINRNFQLRFAFYVCSWLFALSMFYPVVIYQLFDFFVRYAAQDPLGPPLSQLYATRQEMIWLLIGIQFLLLVITFAISIFTSHRIAGPLYKLRTFFREAGTGNLEATLRFRKNDHFQELADEYNLMIQNFRTTLDRNTQSINAATAQIESALEIADPAARQHLEAALVSLGKQLNRNPESV